MTTFKDLEPCTYFHVKSKKLLAVGWLGKDEEFSRGPVNKEFFDQLARAAARPWQPVVCMGYHHCELCQFNPPMFKDNLFVPHAGRIYVAPAGILHYIAAHWYCPPEPFIKAVMECPPIWAVSSPYREALKKSDLRFFSSFVNE